MGRLPTVTATATPSFLRAVSAIRNARSPQEALFLYKLTILRRHDPYHNSYPFDTHAAVFTLKSISHLPSFPILLRHLHCHLLKSGLASNVYVSTSLLNGYVSTSLLNGYVSAPASSSSFFNDGQLLFGEMPTRNSVTYNTMIKGYVGRGDLKSARRLFDEMPERDIASWSAMIGGYLCNGNCGMGLELFRELMRDGGSTCRPDQVTLVTLLSAFSVTGSMALMGKSVHAYCERNGLELTVALGTAFVDMYAKNGCLSSAFTVFEKMRDRRNVASWTAMICGLALHGHGKEALSMFEEMKKAGARPNEITFTSILNACCHAGLIHEAKKAFRSMREEYGMEPTVHHYGCMVDLLGRAGMIREAQEVVENMRVEPNDVVWTSLLSACKVHKDFDYFSDKVTERLLERRVAGEKSGGLYSLVADMFALRGKWGDVERVRQMMDGGNVKKRRGSSMIQTHHKP